MRQEMHFPKKCDAKKRLNEDKLWWRNGVFYFRIELPRVDGKHRYKRLSLHTDNYYEAVEKTKELKKMYDHNFYIKEFERLLKGVNIINSSNPFAPLKLSHKNNLNNLKELLSVRDILLSFQNTNERITKALESFNKLGPAIMAFLDKYNKIMPQSSPVDQSVTIRYKISEILDDWILKGQNCDKENNRKRKIIEKLLSEVKLTLNDDYSKLHNSKTITLIFQNITNLNTIKNDMKRKYIRYIKNLTDCGTDKNPDIYKPNITANAPKIKATKNADKCPHIPYPEDLLIKIFNPEYKFFYDNPDMLMTCLIGLFTGARSNAAATLQYKDIKVIKGISCIEFVDDHEIKSLKTSASERIVPIHPQLLNFGFKEWVDRKKTKLNAKDEDFIFDRCITKGNVYYEKYYRTFFDFITKLNIKTKNGPKYDFHSFRNNLSNLMQSKGIPESYINDIIGWQGNSVMSRFYSKHTLEDIRTQMGLFQYDCLEQNLIKWKKYIEKLWL